MIGTLTYALVQYFANKERMFENTFISPKDLLLWPTYLVLAVSCVTLVMNILTLSAYLCGVGAANKTSDVAGWIRYVMLGAEVIVWAVTSGLYKMADTGKDLWGYTCGLTADQIEAQVKDFVDFGKLCSTQVSD